MAPLRSDSLILTGAASIATRPLLHALLRRRFAAVQLCAELPELADLQTHLSAWCTAQGLPTALRWLAEEPESSFVAPMLPPGWLIHGNTCRAEALLQRNVCTAVRRNIRATAQRLETLPDCGVHLVLLSSHQAAHRSGIAGSTLAAAEALVEAWSASHPAACVQVWRLPAPGCLRCRASVGPRTPRAQRSLAARSPGRSVCGCPGRCPAERLVRRKLEGLWG